MPAFVTHSLFGEDVFAQVKDPGLFRLFAGHRAAFEWGLQGPDLLFYHGAVFSKNRLPGYGNRMHDEKTARLFETASRYLAGERGRPGFEEALAYTMGFCCHYALDRETHPFIFCRQAEIAALCPWRSYSGVHYRLESDIDSALHWVKKGTPVQRFSFGKKFRAGRETKDAVARWYRHVLRQVYGLSVPLREISACFEDTLITLRFLLEPTGKAALLLTRGADRLLGKHAHIEGHARLARPEGDPLNLKHRPWCHLGRPGEERTESFLELYQKAEGEALALMDRMLGAALGRAPWPCGPMPSFSEGDPEL